MRIGQWAAAVVALLGCVFSTAASAAEEHAGAWALRAGGRTLLLLELARDPSIPGGWSGSLTSPKEYQYRIGGTSVAFNGVEGPIVKEPVREVVERGGVLELTVGQRPDQAITYVWRVLPGGQAELGWKNSDAPPLSFSRAAAGETVSASWDKRRSYPLEREWPSNPEMIEIFKADQAARKDPATIDWNKVAAEDAARRERTKTLLDAGALKSGDDFWHAAFIFQHGGRPEDYLLAHTLAVIASARGRPDATWIAAATLDRYLQSIGRQQVYGTQYRTMPGQPTTQEPYNRTLVSDTLREAMGVPVQAEQEKRRAKLEAMNREPAQGK